MKRFAIFLFLTLAFCINADAQYYTYARQKGDTIYLEKKLKERYILKWTKYVYVDKKGSAYQVYLDGKKLVYSKNHVIRNVPKLAAEKIYADIEKKNKETPNVAKQK